MTLGFRAMRLLCKFPTDLCMVVGEGIGVDEGDGSYVNSKAINCTNVTLRRQKYRRVKLLHQSLSLF